MKKLKTKLIMADEKLEKTIDETANEAVDVETPVVENIEEQEEEVPLTAEGLKETTSIGGWLAFFLFAMMAGSVVSAGIMIFQFDLREVGGNWLLALSDPLSSILLFGLACFTLYSFLQRRPGAVFLAKAYVVAVFLSGILVMLASGMDGEDYSFKDIVRPLVWSVVWFMFLCMSTRVETVIPSEYRKIENIDWWVVGVVYAIPMLFLAIGLVQLSFKNQGQEKQKAEFMQSVVLADGEYTDGRVVFACPPGFECREQNVDGDVFYSIESETQGANIVSEFNDDATQENADYYWKISTEEDLKDFRYSAILDEEQTANGNKVFVKTGKYVSKYSAIDSRYVYRRFAAIFHQESGKMCLVNAFDQGDDSYFEPLLRSVRF